jgi:hypothetical protein
MTRVLIVDQLNKGLATLIKPTVLESVTVNSFDQLQQDDILLWLPNDSDVDQQVFGLIDTIDGKQIKLSKIVMLSIAGVNGEVEEPRLQQWWGSDYQNLVLDYQYAIKMIDELELPYTIVRTTPIVINATTAVISNEGTGINGDRIGQSQLAEVLSEACQPNRYLNQSIGISE